MKKLIIHVGNLKTATTTLQENLFFELHNKGMIEYLNHTNDKTQKFGSFNCKNIILYLTGQLEMFDNDAFNNELKSLKKIKKEVTLISNENISLFYNNMDWAHLDSSAILNCKKIKELFYPLFEEIKIVYSIRAQDTLIPSFYAQCFSLITGKNYKYRDIGKWLEQNIFKQSKQNVLFDFYKFYNEYSLTFGKENVFILIYEDLLNEFDSYCERLEQIFGVDSSIINDQLKIKPQNITNKKPNGETLIENSNLGYWLSIPFRSLLKNTILFRVTKRLYGFLIPRILRDFKIGQKKNIRKLKNKEIEIIYQTYRDSNQRLIDLLEIDEKKMKEYNYV